MCEKNCPFDAIHVIDGLAVMNDKCKDCGICAQKCPTGAITGKRPVKPAAPKAPAVAPAASEAKASAPAPAEKPAEQPKDTTSANA
jgi:ferredoxin